jgi:hypothetical protein
MPSIASCQKPEPEHCERRTKRKRNQQELDFERQDDNAHVYTSLESTMPVQFTVFLYVFRFLMRLPYSQLCLWLQLGGYVRLYWPISRKVAFANNAMPTKHM